MFGTHLPYLARRTVSYSLKRLPPNGRSTQKLSSGFATIIGVSTHTSYVGIEPVGGLDSFEA